MPHDKRVLPHKIGEKVFAHIKGSGLWFHGKVLDNVGDYTVDLDDGATYVLSEKDVKAERTFRTQSKSPRRRASSPARRGRSGSRGRPRSSSRSRSRGRGRASSRTPTRQKPVEQKPAEQKPAESLSPSPVQQLRQSRRAPEPKPEPQLARVERAGTPTRHSARIAAKLDNTENAKKEFVPMALDMTHKRVGKTKEKEFGGVIGSFFTMILLPAAVFYINMGCVKKQCSILKLPLCSGKWSDFFDWKAALVYIGWFLFQAALALLPIGEVVEGQILRSGKRLKYRCNGFISLVISLACVAIAVCLKIPITFVYDKFIALVTTSVIFSFVLSVLLYIKARRAHNSELAAGGNTGNVIYDFFMGHELNPRVGNLDLKFFCELRPGLIGWVVINICLIAKDCQTNGWPSSPLLMVTAFQAWYVADALWFEEAILTTMDITQEGFGYMLAFGDLAWVPFLYCLQTRFLLEHSVKWPVLGLVAIFLLNAVGYVIFRGSNSQKNDFRKNPYNPSLTHLESLLTASGRRLLVSGWWGLCRHPNYLGDLIMALAWSLPCGFTHLFPYFYPIYFLILLMHREARDGNNCRKKYGTAWDRYCERVKYRIIPYVY